jgi:hypothetical protein
VDAAVNLHKSSKFKVPSSCKDFMDTAITKSGTGAVAFTAFLALVLLVFCLMAIILLAEEYKSLPLVTKKKYWRYKLFLWIHYFVLNKHYIGMIW